MSQQTSGRVAGVLCFIAGTQFLIVNTIAESIYPNYSVRLNLLSDLGAYAGTALLWNSSLLLLGVLLIFASYHLLLWTGRRDFLVSFILGGGIGPILVAVFNEATIIQVHAVGAYVTFIFGGLAAILSYRFTRPPLGYFAVILGTITIIAIVLLTAGQYLGLGVGGMERMIVYPELIWLVSFGAYLLSS